MAADITYETSSNLNTTNPDVSTDFIVKETDTGRIKVSESTTKKYKALAFQGFPPFEYGNLAALYPTETPAQLRARREGNWDKFKAICELYRTTGEVLRLPADRIEIHIKLNEKIQLRQANLDKLAIAGSGIDVTTIAVYPYVPRPSLSQVYYYDKLFDLQYGCSLLIRDITFLRDNYKKYETYDCVLKKNGTNTLIEIPGATRSGFWTSLVTNATIHYRWQSGVAGGTTTIASVNSSAKTITTNNALTNPSADQSGKIALYFDQDIPESDYNNTYSQRWYVEGDGLDCILLNYAETTHPDFNITLENVRIKQFEVNISLNAKAGKLNFNGACFLEEAQIGLSFFSGDNAGNQTIRINELTVKKCGYEITGSPTLTDAVVGSGGYLHPNIQVRANRLILRENLTGAWRQYSGSGEKPVGSGYFSSYDFIDAYDNDEYDILTSNSLDTYIREIHSDGVVRVGGNLSIGAGDIKILSCNSQAQPDNDGSEFNILVSNCIVRAAQTFAWTSSLNDKLNVEYRECTFIDGGATGLPEIIKSETNFLKNLIIKGGKFIKGVGGTYTLGGAVPATGASRLIRMARIRSVVIKDFFTDFLFSYLTTMDALDTAYDTKGHKILIFDSEINTLGLSNLNLGLPYNISEKIECIRTKVTAPYDDDGTASYIFNVPISAKERKSPPKAILSSQAYIRYLGSVTVNDVLEVSGDYNDYTVKSGNIKVIAPIVYVNYLGNVVKSFSTSCVAGEIIVTAYNGAITFEAFNSTTNANGNILNSFTLAKGKSAKLISNYREVLSTGANSTVTRTAGTGDGTTKIFQGVIAAMSEKQIVPLSVALTAGTVSGTSQIDGIISGTGIAKAYIDYLGGAFYIEFTTAPTNGTSISLQFDIYNSWKNTGTWTVIGI